MTKGSQNKDSKVAFDHAIKSIGNFRKCNGIFHKGYSNGELVPAEDFKRMGDGYQSFCSECDQARQNLELISELGGMPFIPFKKNTKSKGFGSSTWKNMHYYFKQKPQEFYEHYHKRSNVETTFAMIKQKFNGNLMTKNYQANVNEILSKCVAHNVCCLIKAYYTLNIEKTISTEVLNKERI
jgi:hypothetical protein